MLLDHLSRTKQDPALAEAARRIENAVEQALAEGSARTPDIGGRCTTREATQAILAQLAAC
jgi:3-isopropylmalate dehydrogenase